MSSDEALALAVLEDGEWFSRYEFDKTQRQWRQPRWGWVSSADVPLFEQPDKTSKQIDLLKPGMHFGRQGHGHFGHPIAILEERSGWQRVLTCQDVVGWTPSGVLIDTLEMFRVTLNSPVVLRDGGNEGPRMFVWQTRLYMTSEESKRQDQTLRNSDLAAAVAKGQLFGEELRRANHLLTMNNSALLEEQQFRWEAFTRRRQSLERR